MNLSFDDLIWHDGHLMGLSTFMDKRAVATVRIQAMIYPRADASRRRLLEVTCQAVSRSASTLDMLELQRTHWAGNIVSGALKDGALWLYVTDGFIEVRAARFDWAWLDDPATPSP